MYDWANSAFATTIMAALLPPFYRSLVMSAGLTGSTATAYWGYTTAIALLLIALIAPVLGAMSDHTGGRKRYAGFFAGLGILSTAALVFVRTDTWRLASLIFICGNFGFAGANIFYESLLPHIARKDDTDRVSSKGYAMGYMGGGILLVINTAWVMRPATFGMPDVDFAMRASFVSVAVWWGVFSLPFFRYVPEPSLRNKYAGGNPLAEGFSRVASTFREVKRYRQLLIFLIAFWIYNDGISTIIKMATAYGDEIGIKVTDMAIALIVTQFVGVPFSFLFGALARRLGAKPLLFLALGVYTCISLAGYCMRTATHFYILAFMVGTVQGGSQALSRSLYAAMVPRHKAAEFFGFFSTSGKFAGIAGPLLFGLISQITGRSRLSILSLIIFFVVGGILLACVDEKQGIHAARKAEEEHAATRFT